MAALTATNLTLLDWSKRMDPDGGVADIVEILSQPSEVLQDMIWREGNLPTGHRTTIRTGLPTAAWRMMNAGVPKAKSTTAQITAQTSMLEVYSEIDKAEATLNGNTNAFRTSEDTAFIQGMNQQLEAQLWYGTNTATPERFPGIASHLSTLVVTTASAVNVIDAAGSSTDNTSIYLVGWGDQTVHGIFPKGSKAGLQRQDLGEVTLLDAAGNQYQGYRTHYKWDAGLVVKDWRYIARAANIDVSDLAGATPAVMSRLFTRLMMKMPTLQGIKPAYYVNRAVKTWATIQAQEKANMGFTSIKDAQGFPIVEFMGIPIRLSDQILNTETEVPGP